MQIVRRIVAATLAVLIAAPAYAQKPHVINPSALDQAVQQRVAQEQADREAIRAFLGTPAVRGIAAKAGVPIERAEAAVSTLQGDELRQVAGQVRGVNDQLAGGSTLVISTTTIIIILLLIILLIVALQ
jgi:hypothetical protein